MKILVRIKKCLILVIFEQIQNIMIIETNQLLVRQKMKQVVLLSKSMLDERQTCSLSWQMIGVSIKNGMNENTIVNDSECFDE